MVSRSPKLEPRSPPKYQKDTNMYSKFQKCRRDCHTRASRSLTMLQKHHQATQSGTYALGKSQRCKKTRTNRPRPGARRRRRRSGRGLEGRAHQAASRRPRSGAEASIEVQVTRSLFLNSNKGVQALPPTFYRDPPLPTRRQSFFVLTHMDAQRVKTRGPNPNPTTQAEVQTLFAALYKNSKYH